MSVTYLRAADLGSLAPGATLYKCAMFSDRLQLFNDGRAMTSLVSTLRDCQCYRHWYRRERLGRWLWNIHTVWKVDTRAPRTLSDCSYVSAHRLREPGGLGDGDRLVCVCTPGPME